MKTTNHFITVARTGELWARRKGCAPVRVASAAEGIAIETDEAARAAGAPATVRVRFAHGGGNRELRVTTVHVGDIDLDPDAFLARFAVSGGALGRWIRAAVERALDAADRRSDE